MACTFSIPFSGDAGSLTTKLQSKISGSGTFEGDDNNGKFRIGVMGATIEGSYTIQGNEMQVTIERKPIFVGCDMIRDYVLQNLAV